METVGSFGGTASEEGDGPRNPQYMLEVGAGDLDRTGGGEHPVDGQEGSQERPVGKRESLADRRRRGGSPREAVILDDGHRIADRVEFFQGRGGRFLLSPSLKGKGHPDTGGHGDAGRFRKNREGRKQERSGLPAKSPAKDDGGGPLDGAAELPVDRDESFAQIAFRNGDPIGDNGGRKRLGIVVHDHQPLHGRVPDGKVVKHGDAGIADADDQAAGDGSAHRDLLLKIPPKPCAIRSSIPSGLVSLVIRRAYLVSPIAVEYCGFSKV